MKSIGRYQNKASFKKRRRCLRTCQTEAEKILWYKLKAKQLGVKFRRQFNIDYYIVDFYSHELKLIIEIDGYIHAEKENKKKDIIRQKYLQQNGYFVLRYRNEQIKYELDNVINDIIFYIKNLSI